MVSTKTKFRNKSKEVSSNNENVMVAPAQTEQAEQATQKAAPIRKSTGREEHVAPL